ncbi:MAG TPA: hypothetical protein VK745_27395 [Polyangiaceae bacterium]|nr:hypothetical protein [Polyangiaceae bacterium]
MPSKSWGVCALIGSTLVAAAGCGAPGTDGSVGETASALSSAQDVLGFEALSAWHASSGHAALTANHTEGMAAFALSAPVNYTTLTSAPIASTSSGLLGLSHAGSKLSLDLLLPTLQPNAFYFGALQLYISVPSRGLYHQFLGQVELSQRPLGVFQTLDFPVNDSIRASLNGATFSDLTFTLALNAPAGARGTYLFDNLRVTGAAPVLREFPTSDIDGPQGITTGPDGALWFTEGVGNRIGRITTAGVITEFPVPTPDSNPAFIALGADGNLWFTEFDANNIGRITPQGVISEFAVPTPSSGPIGITLGSDGNVWFTELSAPKIGKITPAGVISELPVTIPNSLITSGSDGNLWFTEENNVVARLTTGGVLTEFTTPTTDGDGFGIAAGPGVLWFAELHGDRIGRLTTTSGTFSEFAVPTAASEPYGITVAPDGSAWFGELDAGNIGHVTSAGQISEIPLGPTAVPVGITTGPDGGIWFTEFGTSKIGELLP